MSTEATANPAGTFLIFVMYACAGIIAINIGFPADMVINAMATIAFLFTVLYVTARIAWRFV